MVLDKTKIKAIIKNDMDGFAQHVSPGWTAEAILLDAMDQPFQMDGIPIQEAVRQIKSSGQSWDDALKNETVNVMLESSQELFDTYYPSLWSQIKPVIESPLLLTMQIMPTLLGE